MSVFEHRIIAFGQHQAPRINAHIRTQGTAAVTAAGGRVFGVFTPRIGHSLNHTIILTEWPDDAAATQYGACVLGGAEGVTAEQCDLWDPTVRPVPGETLPEPTGCFSHRWFLCREADWPRFLELSDTAWDNFEGVHPTRVVGFWRSRRNVGPGLLEVRLMAWYKDLSAWEGSRFWAGSADPAAAAAHSRFRERAALTIDTAVTVMWRAE